MQLLFIVTRTVYHVSLHRSKVKFTHMFKDWQLLQNASVDHYIRWKYIKFEEKHSTLQKYIVLVEFAHKYVL